MTEIFLAEVIKLINEEIRAIVERIRQNLSPKKIYLFGSFARGDAGKYSDYDFYVVMPDGSGNPLELCQDAYCSLIGLERKRGADIIVGHESAFAERKSRPTIEREVDREGILLYG